MSISEIPRFSVSESLNFLDRTTFFGQFLSESRFRVIIGTCIKTQVLEFRVGHSPNPKNRKQRKIFEWSELERVWVYFIWQLLTRWLLSQYCHYPLSRDSYYSNPCTTYTSTHSNRNGMKIDISYDILMPVDDGSRLKNLNLVVALTCFRLEGTELFPLLTGDKTAITISNHFSFVNTPSNQNPFRIAIILNGWWTLNYLGWFKISQF